MKILSIVNIRPDIIRLSKIFEKLDKNFQHTIVHSGQHWDYELDKIFYKDFNSLRFPDYNLQCGKDAKNHYDFVSIFTERLINLIEEKKLNPDYILMLGDSNGVLISVPLVKNGYKVIRLEAGMRSGLSTQFEEINRKVADTVSDICMCYHEDNIANLLKENKPREQCFNIGNTILEPALEQYKHLGGVTKRSDCVLVDIHRPENFQSVKRLKGCLDFVRFTGQKFNLPVNMLYFKRTLEEINKHNLDLSGINMIPLKGYLDYQETAYHSKIVVSDSGSAQDELGVLKTPCIVPRAETERNQSYLHSCSIMVDVENSDDWNYVLDQALELKFDISWLGDGHTSDCVVEILKSL